MGFLVFWVSIIENFLWLSANSDFAHFFLKEFYLKVKAILFLLGSYFEIIGLVLPSVCLFLHPVSLTVVPFSVPMYEKMS